MPTQVFQQGFFPEGRVGSSDLHPHDPLLGEFFTELLIAKQELDQQSNFSAHFGFSDPLNRALLSEVTHSGAVSRIRNLLDSDSFSDALPYLLERLNTPVERLNLPRRGRNRNLDRSELNTYYTPIDLARWVASLTTKKFCSGVQLKANGKGPAQMLDELSALRVADFSCGSGVLLREAAEWIVRAYETLWPSLTPEELAQLPEHRFRFFKKGFHKLQCLSSNIYGIDISPKSLESAKVVILLWAMQELRQAPAELPTLLRLLQLNFKAGSGAHWEIHREHVLTHASIRATCEREAEIRALLRQQILTGEPQASAASSGTEIVQMFPEAFIESSDPGFSCIVGNPPYGELPIEFEAQLSTTLFSGVPNASRRRNQYTKFASSLLYLLRNKGFGAIVAPLGLAYNSAETKSLRSEIKKQNRQWNFAFFDRSPDALFGDSVKTRNVVLFCAPTHSGSPEIRTTHFLRWTRPMRARLWGSVTPVCIGATVDIAEFVPKLGTDLEVCAWKAVRSKTAYLRGFLQHSSTSEDSTLYCYSTAYNWLPFFRHNPASFADGVRQASPSTRQYAFRTPKEADFFYACLVSGLSFWLWTVEADGFHLTNAFVEKLPFTPELFPSDVNERLAELGHQHNQVICKSPTVKNNAGQQILNFNRHGAQPIVEQIDMILLAAFCVPQEFRGVLQMRVRDLIFAGRKTTRVHAAQF